MEEYVVSKEYLDELMTEWTKCVMGQCMKRFELHNNDTVLKKEIKELSPDTVDFPFTDPSFKNKEQWSSKKYAYREFKRKKEIFK